MRVLMLLLPALAAALMPRVPLAPASRPTAAASAAAVRTSRPVMLVEAVEAVVQSGFLVDGVVDMPMMTLGDAGLLDSVQALSPVAQGVYCAQRHDSNLAILAIEPAGGPTNLTRART